MEHWAIFIQVTVVYSNQGEGRDSFIEGKDSWAATKFTFRPRSKARYK